MKQKKEKNLEWACLQPFNFRLLLLLFFLQIAWRTSRTDQTTRADWSAGPVGQIYRLHLQHAVTYVRLYLCCSLAKTKSDRILLVHLRLPHINYTSRRVHTPILISSLSLQDHFFFHIVIHIVVKGFNYFRDVLHWGFRSSVSRTFSATDVSCLFLDMLNPASGVVSCPSFLSLSFPSSGVQNSPLALAGLHD